MEIRGASALVTGAGRGIGRAIAKSLGREGAKVALVSRTRAELEAVAAEIEAAGGQAFVFAADLIRALHSAGLSPEVEFLSLSSYGAGTASSGEVRVVRDIDSDVAGRDVLLIDDILESGRTLAFAKSIMEARGARRVGVAVLLEKPGKRAQPIEADHVGFICPDLFVVGYGMDVAHAFRELPFVGVVKGEG